MIKLLVLKAGEEYFRFSGVTATACRFDKASVFPLDAVEEVKARRTRIREAGITNVEIRILTIKEEQYEESVEAHSS